VYDPGITQKNDYMYQMIRYIPIGNSIPNKKLRKLFFQPHSLYCHRDNLDEIINYNRYRYAKIGTKIGITPLDSYSFPSKFGGDNDPPLPVSSRGLPGDKLEKDRSGLLSNIYISFDTLIGAINDTNNASYVDIYNSIFKVLMDSVDGFWDLGLVDGHDGTITIIDKKYISKYALKKQENSVYSFDYYDSDSIIKSLKFRPVMSDAQATRVIYGEVNNKDSKFKYFDKNDVLDYKFKDCVIGTEENKALGNDGNGELQRRLTALDQLKDLVRSVQNINSKDNSLQMSLNTYRRSQPSIALVSVPGSNRISAPPDMREIVKLVLGGPSGQQLLRLLLNDDDTENNGRYCAVQPGIILELTLQGIGGLRTFQYFLVNHLPEPYSERDIIFRITDVHQTLESGNWETTIRAQPLPLRKYIKDRLIGPGGASTTNTLNGWLPDLPL